MALLGLCCCIRVFSSGREQGLQSSCDWQASHCSGFFCCWVWALGWAGFNSFGLQALLLQGMWDPPTAKIKPKFLALAGIFSNTGTTREAFIYYLHVCLFQRKTRKVLRIDFNPYKFNSLESNCFKYFSMDLPILDILYKWII